MVSNRDIGFVHEGQDAADQDRHVQLHPLRPAARPCQIRVAGRHYARQAADDKTDKKQQAGAESEVSEPKGQELVYSARVSLDQTQMQIDDRMVNLEPGMAVTAEIKTGHRHVISYLLSPLARHKHNALRER